MYLDSLLPIYLLCRMKAMTKCISLSRRHITCAFQIHPRLSPHLNRRFRAQTSLSVCNGFCSPASMRCRPSAVICSKRRKTLFGGANAMVRVEASPMVPSTWLRLVSGREDETALRSSAWTLKYS